MMEVLSRTLCRMKGMGYIFGFSVDVASDKGIKISHLLFANDTIMFCDANKEQLLFIRMVFTYVEAVTGLEVNLNKNEVILVGWNTVCSLFAFGGLVVHKLCTFNHTLLGKWLWRFVGEETHLWRQDIGLKYGADGGG